jgi:hypothetical protein
VNNEGNLQGVRRKRKRKEKTEKGKEKNRNHESNPSERARIIMRRSKVISFRGHMISAQSTTIMDGYTKNQ